MAFRCVRGRDERCAAVGRGDGGRYGKEGERKKERRGTKEEERKSERCVCRLRKKQTGKREGGRASAGLAKRHSVKLTAII